MLLAAAPAGSAPAQVRTFGAVPKSTGLIIAVDGKNRVRNLRFEQTTKRFALRRGRHVVTVKNRKGVRIARSAFTVRDDERVTLAIVGTPTRPAIAAIREARPGDGPRRWARLANLAPGRRLDLRLAGQPFTLVRSLRFARTSKNFVVPGRTGAYGEPGRVVLALLGAGSQLDQQSITIAVGSAVTLVALPNANGAGVKLRALAR
jgi:hypothetical protein